MRPTWCFRTNHSEHKTSCNFIHRHAKKHVIFGQKISNWSKYHTIMSYLCVTLNVFKFVGTVRKRRMVVCIFTNINLNIDLQVQLYYCTRDIICLNEKLCTTGIVSKGTCMGSLTLWTGRTVLTCILLSKGTCIFFDCYSWWF